ncbi:MAG: tyrosine-type recombinase/integrase, partial [Fidelibacterota bacterium]
IHFPTTKTYQGRSIPLTRRVREVLEGRKDIVGGPFHFTVYTVYNRTKFAFKKAGIDDISTHNLRRTAGTYYYMATRDIFSTSRFLGHSSVNVTEKHYVGLIQSLQTQYADEFDKTLTNILENR